MSATLNLIMWKGGLFSYIGELRLDVNRTTLVDYTGWTITGRVELDGTELPILTVEWIDVTTGIFRIKIAVDDQEGLQQGKIYKLYIVPITPGLEPLAPILINLTVRET